MGITRALPASDLYSRSYNPPKCQHPDCSDEGRYNGLCMKHWRKAGKEGDDTVALSDEQIREAVAAAATNQQAVEALGISVNGLRQRCRKLGIQMPTTRMGGSKAEIPLDRFREVVAQAADANAAAAALGMGPSAVRIRCRRNRIRPPWSRTAPTSERPTREEQSGMAPQAPPVSAPPVPTGPLGAEIVAIQQMVAALELLPDELTRIRVITYVAAATGLCL